MNNGAFVVRVVGSTDHLSRLRNFIKPFSHTEVAGGKTSATAAATAPARDLSALSVLRKPQNIRELQEFHFCFVPSDAQPELFHHDTTIMLCDAGDQQSLDTVADTAAHTVEPMVPLVVVDICELHDAEASTTSFSGVNPVDAESARAELNSQLLSLPEYCGIISLVTTDDSAGGGNGNNNAGVRALNFSPNPTSPTASTGSKQQQHPHQQQIDAATLDLLCGACADSVLCPKHVLWDGAQLTGTARKAIRRSFWLLDRDGDGALSDSELIQFLHAVYGSYSSEDIAEVKSFVQNIIDSQVEAGADPAAARAALLSNDGFITLLGFFGICHVMVSDARHKLVWQLFAAHGVEPDCRPFRDADIARAIALPSGGGGGGQEEQQLQLHLSETGVSFFASLYLSRPRQNPRDLFLFTPDCPWKTIYGMPNAEEERVPVGEFVHCWRFMALVDPATVAAFARYWAFSGDLASLFVAYRTRRFRHLALKQQQQQQQQQQNKQQNGGKATTSSSSSASTASISTEIPPTATFLVLGSGHCGKTELMQHIADPQRQEKEAEQQQEDQDEQRNRREKKEHVTGRSVSIVPVHPVANRVRSEVCVVLRELDDAEIDEVIGDAAFMDTVDGVLLCYDGSDPYSFGFVAAVLPRLAKIPHLPVLVALCKADLRLEDQLGLVHGPEQVLTAHGLPWPPTIVSAFGGRKLAANGGLHNDIENIPMILAELVVQPDLLYQLAARDGGGSSNSDAAGRGVGFLRTVKRAVVLAAAGYAAYRVGEYLDREYHWTKQVPWLVRGWKQTKKIAANAVPSKVQEKVGDALRTVRESYIAPAVDGVRRKLIAMLQQPGDGDVKK